MNLLRTVKYIDYALKTLAVIEGVLFMSDNPNLNDATEKIEETANQAKDRAEATASEARSKAEEAASQVRDAASQARSKAEDTFSQAKEQFDQAKEGSRKYWEEIEVEGRQLIDRVKELIQEGNVRRLIIKDEDGKYLVEIPLTVGVVAGSILALGAPVMAALGALAALVAHVKIDVQREEDTPKK